MPAFITLRILFEAAVPWAAIAWGAACLLFPRRHMARLGFWGALCLAVLPAQILTWRYTRIIPALLFRPWEVFPVDNMTGVVWQPVFLALCGFPVCLVLAALLDTLRKDLTDGSFSRCAPLFWFAAVGTLYVGMLSGIHGHSVLPDFGGGAGFFAGAVAFGLEAAYHERERKRGRGVIRLSVAAALLLLGVSALLDSPAALFLLPLAPIRLCYAILWHGPGAGEERLVEMCISTELNIQNIGTRLRVLEAPRRSQGETPGFWLLPEAPDSAVLEQLARDGGDTQDEP